MKLRKTFLLLLAAVLILTATGCGQDSGGNEKVAVINGEAIYRQELDTQMEQVKASYQQQGQDLEAEENKEVLENLKKQVLDEMINNTVLLQQAEKEGVNTRAQEVESQLEEIKSQFDDENQFNQALETNNLTEADLKKEISDQYTVERYMQKVIAEEQLSVAEDEVKDFYDQEIEQQPEGEKPDFEEVKTQIEEMLKQEKMQEAKSELLKGLKENMQIEVLL